MRDGADTVMVQEEAMQGDGHVTLAGKGPSGPGGNTRRKGLDFSAKRDLLVAQG